jgi:hypothetical protein
VVADFDTPFAERLGKLVRMLSSTNDGEVVAAARAIERTLRDNALDIHDLADMLASDKGASAAALEDAYRAGYRDGSHAADVEDDTLSWREVAKFCQARAQQLRRREREFVEHMVRWTGLGREPSDRQARWLDFLYSKLKHEPENQSERRRGGRRRGHA